MDPKELRGLMEAYSEVYAPQEIDEAVKGASRHDTEMRKAAASERRSGIKPLPAKEGEKYAKYKMAQMDYAKRKRMGEEVSVFDVVLEFLQVEGFAETLEEAEWLMANVIDEEAIDIILGEGHGSRRSFKTQSKDERWRVKAFGSNYTPHKNYDPEANRGQGQILRPNQAEKQRRKKLAKSAMGEEFELWVNALVEEGYDLSGYTWDEMYEFYLDEDAGIISGLAGLALGAKGASYAAKHTKRMRDYPKNFVKGIVDPRTYGSKKKKEQKEEFVDEAEKPFPYEKVKAKQVALRDKGGNALDRRMRMGTAVRRAKEAEKTGGSQQSAGAGWYHAKEDYVNEAQHARENPEKYEREQSKKYAPVRGERTPMPPRGDKRREDFEKWYAKNVR
jgi:hypothetical protein